MFYTGSTFPAKYKNGAFIAFHGSWNRAPEPQAGFNVVFQPLKRRQGGGRVRGVRRRLRAERRHGTRDAASGTHRPTGLAQGTDGSLYVADDAGGRIYKIVYTGK